MAYLEVAQAYTDNVRLLFAQTPGPRERSAGSKVFAAPDLADQAEKLATISTRLTTESSNKLAATNSLERAEASNQLLAKALTDLTVSAYLLEAAEDKEAGIESPRTAPRERSITASPPDDLLQIIVGSAPAASPKPGRTVRKALSMPVARETLSQTIDDTIYLISQRTSTAGQAALTGLFGIGLAQAGQAAGIVGQGIAEAFGQAERLSRLYALFRDFAHKAYESVLALLGPVAAQVAGQQVLDWLAEVKEAKFIGNLLEKIYDTRQTQEALLVMVGNTGAASEKLESAGLEVSELGQQCSRQTALVEKLLKGLKYLGGVPAAVLPYGTLLLAGAYIAIVAFLVFNGADYLDADRLKIFNRVRGIRQVIEANLASA